MIARYYDHDGIRIVELNADGPPLRTDSDAVDAISEAMEHQPGLIVIPTQRLDDDFFRLKTGVAGQVIQKFLTYGLRLVIVGDISKHLQESSVLRDFVYECNSGSNVWFVDGTEELRAVLAGPRRM